MENIMSWTDEDEAIIATNTDATECKRCAVELGYWKDDYICYFAKHVDRKAPEINRGYYARVRGIELFINQFLERCNTKCQIINLGCGFDTLYWRLKDTTQAVGNFIELDLPSVTAKKAQIIKRNKKLMEKLCSEDGEVVIQCGDVHAGDYHLCGADLRCAADVRRKLAAAGAAGERPTLILAECVLVYLRPAQAGPLLRALAAQFPRGALLLYEQCALADRFGAVMERQLSARGCPLAGAVRGPADDHVTRLLELGWQRAAAWDMRAVWAALPEEDRARVMALEPLDEAELLQQLHAHYALVLATQGDHFSDMHLHA